MELSLRNARPLAREWNFPERGSQERGFMAKSVGCVHHVSRANIHTLDNTKNGNK